MKIKTKLLQSMVAKAIKGSSNNKMIPITSLIGIELKEVILTLMTTDGSNQLRINEKLTIDNLDPMYGPINNQEFYTIVNAETFSKLVGKTTTEYIELTNNDSFLEFKGNGNYKLQIPMNEEGEIVKFKEMPTIEETNSQKVSVEKLKQLLLSSKPSVAKTMEVPCLTGYYLGDTNITTDRQMVTNINEKLLEKPLLISNEMAELLQLLEGETVTLYQKENEIIFQTNNILIYGKQLEGLDIYPVKAIENLVKLSYDNIVKVNKQELLNVLDRMSLFVTDYDKNGVILNFSNEGLTITSQKSSATEVIETDRDTNKEYADFTCMIDIEMLKAQVQNVIEEVVEIHYGQEKSISIVEGNVTSIISLLQDNNKI